MVHLNVNTFAKQVNDALFISGRRQKSLCGFIHHIKHSRRTASNVAVFYSMSALKALYTTLLIHTFIQVFFFCAQVLLSAICIHSHSNKSIGKQLSIFPKDISMAWILEQPGIKQPALVIFSE